MKTNTLKQFAHELSEKAATLKATPAAMLATVIKSIFADEPMPDARLSLLSNVSPRTIKNCAEQIEQLSTALKAYDLTQCEANTQETLTPSKNAEKALVFEDLLRYPDDFAFFLKCYPNHGTHRATSKNYQKMLSKLWRDCEKEGYTGEDIIYIFITKRYCAQWQSYKASEIPTAWEFLSHIVYRFPATNNPVERTPEELANIDPEFIKFCREYPLPTDPCDAKVYKMWQQRIQEGITNKELLCCIDCCNDNPKWQEDSGRYIPYALKWLIEERYFCYLPYVRDLLLTPRGGRLDEDRADDARYFKQFCNSYPGETGAFLTEENFRLWQAWKKCERSKGLNSQIILWSLDEAIKNNKWDGENKHLVPHAITFLHPRRMKDYTLGMR